MFEEGIGALALLGLTLGLRHGFDWDHIAAITDITSSTVTVTEAREAGLPPEAAGSGPGAALALEMENKRWRGMRAGFFYAELYALGHAIVVVALGLLAIWASAVLPDWIDPVMERVVGVTLLFLGVWIFYSLWRYGRSFRLQSRWMVIFGLVNRGWARLKSRLSGEQIAHSHEPQQYGARTSLAIGMIHGIGAETGSQALLLAAAAGATTALTGTVMLFSFVIGLVLSNTLVAAFAIFGFVSAVVKRNIYFGVGVLAGIFSLIVGAFFVTGMGSDLPDLQEVLNGIFGGIAGPQAP